jgi:hypothetical protein
LVSHRSACVADVTALAGNAISDHEHASMLVVQQATKCAEHQPTKWLESSVSPCCAIDAARGLAVEIASLAALTVVGFRVLRGQAITAKTPVPFGCFLAPAIRLAWLLQGLRWCNSLTPAKAHFDPREGLAALSRVPRLGFGTAGQHVRADS